MVEYSPEELPRAMVAIRELEVSSDDPDRRCNQGELCDEYPLRLDDGKPQIRGAITIFISHGTGAVRLGHACSSHNINAHFC